MSRHRHEVPGRGALPHPQFAVELQFHIPVSVRVGGTSWATSLYPKDGQYLLPVKAAVRKAERLTVGDDIAVRLAVDI